MVQAKHLFDELDYATCDDATRADFETWIAHMKPERDGEYGLDRSSDGQVIPGFLSWIQMHNRNEKFANSALYRTFIWKDRVSGEIVATGTVAPDDRGIKDRYDLGGEGHLGGLNVRFDLRNRGIGRYVRARIEHHIADFARRRGRSQLIHAFSHMRGPRQLGSGFHRNKIAMVETDFGSLPLWSKMYSP
jgi:GNAT superfamily N-acetyltransferase